MIYSSPREARSPGFDRWYWDLLAALPKAKRLLVVAGAYDSDGTIRELLDEAKRRGIPAAIHFVEEEGPLPLVYESSFPTLAEHVIDLDSFTEEKGISLEGSSDEITFGF
jgi:hypothetical protein